MDMNQPPALTTFLEYCHSLNKWERNLLATVELLYPPHKLMLLLTSMLFQACSDGSAVFQQGAFGWALALSSKTWLAYGAGPVDSHNSQLFHSKGQGMLSIVRFLSWLRTWTKSDAFLSGVLSTNNSQG
jgi:hypothetical protein